jgi:hypothetical protein
VEHNSVTEPFQKLASEGYDVPKPYLEYEQKQNAVGHRRLKWFARDSKEHKEWVNAHNRQLDESLEESRRAMLEYRDQHGEAWLRLGPSAPHSSSNETDPIWRLIRLVAAALCTSAIICCWIFWKRSPSCEST